MDTSMRTQRCKAQGTHSYSTPTDYPAARGQKKFQFKSEPTQLRN